jgi:hypothetical protein
MNIKTDYRQLDRMITENGWIDEIAPPETPEQKRKRVRKKSRWFYLIMVIGAIVALTGTGDKQHANKYLIGIGLFIVSVFIEAELYKKNKKS